MSVAEILEQRNAFSFEVFPPKTDAGMEKLCGEGGVLEKLQTYLDHGIEYTIHQIDQ